MNAWIKGLFTPSTTTSKDNCPVAVSARQYQPPVLMQTANTWSFALDQPSIGGRPVVGRATSNTPLTVQPTGITNLPNRRFDGRQPVWCVHCL